jgi:hypothetical protein
VWVDGGGGGGDGYLVGPWPSDHTVEEGGGVAELKGCNDARVGDETVTPAPSRNVGGNVGGITHGERGRGMGPGGIHALIHLQENFDKRDKKSTDNLPA